MRSDPVRSDGGGGADARLGYHRVLWQWRCGDHVCGVILFFFCRRRLDGCDDDACGGGAHDHLRARRNDVFFAWSLSLGGGGEMSCASWSTCLFFVEDRAEERFLVFISSSLKSGLKLSFPGKFVDLR